MKNIIDELDKKKMQSKMVLQIHDELIFEFPKNEESSLKKLVVDKMENVVAMWRIKYLIFMYVYYQLLLKIR